MIGLRMDCLERIRGAENKKLRKSRDIKSHRSGVDTAAIITIPSSQLSTAV